jgi:hypothetical protein
METTGPSRGGPLSGSQVCNKFNRRGWIMAQHVRITGLRREFDAERFADLVLALAEQLAAAEADVSGTDAPSDDGEGEDD